MSNKMFWATGLTGGGDALDAIDGNDVTVGDGAIALYNDGVSNLTCEYRVEASGATESSPGIISPDTNAGTLRWHLISKTYEVDVRGFVSINAAVTAIGASITTLVVANAQTLTANLTIPSTLGLKILKGGSIVKSSTYTVTINGPFEAGVYQVFSGFSAGNIKFNTGSVKEIYVEWWGAVRDNSTDDLTSFLCASYASFDSGSSVVLMPGIYKITNSIAPKKDSPSRPWGELRITGAGFSPESDHRTLSSAFGTTIHATTTNPIFLLESTRDVSISNMLLVGEGAGGSIAIDINNSNARVRVTNIGVANFEIGVQFKHHDDGVLAANDDDNIFDGLYFDYVTTAFRSNSTSTYSNRVINTTFYSDVHYILRVDGYDVSDSFSSDFIFDKCFFLNSTAIIKADIRSGQRIIVRDSLIEMVTDGVLIDADSGGVSYQLPCIEFSGNLVNHSMTDGTPLIVYRGVGSLSFTRNKIVTVNPTTKIEGNSPFTGALFMGNNWLYAPNHRKYSDTTYGHIIEIGEMKNLYYGDTGGTHTMSRVNEPLMMRFIGKDIRFSDFSISGQSLLAGSVIFDSTPSETETPFQQVIQSGTTGTLSTTGSINNASNQLTVANSNGLFVGAYITIVGVTGIKRVLAINYSTDVVTIDVVSDATVVGAAVAYSAPTYISYHAVRGTTGGYKRMFAEATATLSGASTFIEVNVPAFSKRVGVQLRVDTAITSGDGATSWKAKYFNGATGTSLATGQAFTKNTKVNKMHTEEIEESASVDILIEPNSNTFSGGVIRGIVYYEALDTMADAP